MKLSRRDMLLASATLLGTPRPARAEEPREKPAIVLIYLVGGYNAFFSAADGYVPKGLYQCSSSNVRDLGNGVVVDKATVGSLPDSVLGKMATVGVLHRASGHDFARRYAWYDGPASVPLKLADALGGSAAFRCVHFGSSPGGVHTPYNGVPMTAVPDLTAALTLFSNQASATGPRRTLMARALRASLDLSRDRFARSPNALSHTWEGTHTLVNALEQPPPRDVDWPSISAAYGLPAADLSATSFASNLAGAEVMLKAGADVVVVTSEGVKLGAEFENWDTHGDGTGAVARQMMTTGILPSLSVFLERSLAMAGRNVVTLLWGDFARIGGLRGGSEHANGVSASVFGKYVRPGTTGQFTTGPVPSDEFYILPSATPDYRGLWSLLTALTRAPKTPWGSTPHAALVA